jgi:hypothetical protein
MFCLFKVNIGVMGQVNNKGKQQQQQNRGQPIRRGNLSLFLILVLDAEHVRSTQLPDLPKSCT